MMRARRLLIATLLLLAVAGMVLIGAKVYLRSDRALARAVSRLEAVYGGPVRLERIDIGTEGLTLHGLQLYESGAGPSDPPWLTAREVETDVTALDLLDGSSAPRNITLTGAAVVLRFDRANRLLTRLPRSRPGAGALPHVRICDGRFTIRQEGRPDTVVNGIDAELRPDDGRLIVTGTTTDPAWGDWTLDGAFDVQTGVGALSLKTARVHVTPTRLEALPFVPPRVWEQVQAEGDSPVELTFRFDTGFAAVRYRVTAAPEAARLRVTVLDLEADRVSGQVIVEDGRVRLEALRGRTADGDLEMTGDLDFRAAPPRLDLDLAARGLAIRRLPTTWGLPAPLDGRFTGRARLHVLLAADRTRASGEGRGTIERVRIAGLPARPIDVRLRPDPVEDRSFLEATIALDDADPVELARGLGVELPFPVTGRLVLALEAAIPLDTIRDGRTCRADGTVTGNRLEVNGFTVEDIEATLRLRDGNLSVLGLRGLLEAMPFTGDARVELDGPYRCHARLDVGNGDLAMLRRFLPSPLLWGRGVRGEGEDSRSAMSTGVDIGGWFALTADLHGTLKPLVLAARGTARVHPLRLDDVKLDHAEFRWDSDGQRLNVFDLSAALYGGRLSGTAAVPLRGNEPTSAALRFHDLDLNLLAREVPGLPFELEGRADGSAEGKLTARSPGQPPDVAARIEVRVPRLRVQGLPAEDIHGTFTYQGRAGDYRCEGHVLGGRFLLEGRLPSPGREAAEGRLQVEEVQLARLWPVLGGGETLRPLQGAVDLELGFRHETRGRPSGSGRFMVRRLRWDEAELAGSLRGDVLLDRRELRLRDVTGTVGEGLLLAQAGFDLDRPERGWFSLGLQHVEASRLLAPWSGWAGHVQGPLDLRLRGTLGRECRGEGRLSLARGRLLGVEVADVQAPVDFVFAPRFGHGQLHVREGGAQVAMGRAIVRASASWGAGARLEGQVRFFGVELRTLLRQAMELSQVGGGRMSGRIDFSGSDVRSLDDLTASIEASFAQTQALEMPVLRQLAPYLVPGQASSPVFPSGELRAHLSRGVIRVQRLTLAGTLLQVLLEGTMTLQGRLDLSVTANTGRSDLRAAGPRLPGGAIPLDLVRQASGFLANRLVRLRLSGTVRNPRIQVEPLPVLNEEVLRFFLGRS